MLDTLWLRRGKTVPATIISRDERFDTANAAILNNDLWLPANELKEAAGWELKPQGFCLGERCVPVPPGREAEFVSGDRVNLSALARQSGQPLVHDERHSAWSLGQTAEITGAQLRSLQAPDFTLPDLDGQPHSLSDYRGTKVLLMSWASW
jgi:hypothetical protein